jgi:hypothetical protein
VQKLFAANREELARQGILYPHPGDYVQRNTNDRRERHRLKGNGGHMIFATALVGSRKAGPGRSHLVSASSEIFNIAVAGFLTSTCDRMVLSSEGFAVRSKRMTKETFPPALRDVERALVVFFRRKDHWVLSRYKQQIKDKRRISLSAGAFTNGMPKSSLNYFAICDNLTRYFEPGKVALIDYDRHRSDIIAPFRDAIGGFDLAPGGGETGSRGRGRANPSFSGRSSLFLLGCNIAGVSEPTFMQTRTAVEQHDAGLVERFGDVNILPPDLRRSLIETHNMDVTKINDRFGSDLGLVALDDPSLGEPAKESLSRREMGETLDYLASHLPAAALRELQGVISPRRGIRGVDVKPVAGG